MATQKFNRWPSAPPEVRFRAKVDTSGGPEACWPWLGCRQSSGYGQFWPVPKKVRMRAHRYAWELTYGAIPAGLCARHKCDNPECCNPEHLGLGTHADNMQDRAVRLTGARGSKLRQAKFGEQDVVAIRQRYHAGELQRVLAAEFGVGQDVISRLVNGKTWRHV